jgi:hypothetical protein
MNRHISPDTTTSSQSAKLESQAVRITMNAQDEAVEEHQVRTCCVDFFTRHHVQVFHPQIERGLIAQHHTAVRCLEQDFYHSPLFGVYVSNDRTCTSGRSSSSMVTCAISERFLTRPHDSPSGVSDGHNIPHCDGCKERGPLTFLVFSN